MCTTEKRNTTEYHMSVYSFESCLAENVIRLSACSDGDISKGTNMHVNHLISCTFLKNAAFQTDVVLHKSRAITSLKVQREGEDQW